MLPIWRGRRSGSIRSLGDGGKGMRKAMNDGPEAAATDTRLARLARQVRRQQVDMLAMGLVAGGGLLAAFSSPQKTIEAQAVRIVDATGKPRILIGAPPPKVGRLRKDGQTASSEILGDAG